MATKAQPQQGGAGTAPQPQPQQAGGAQPQQQAGKPIFNDWASI